MGQHILSSKFTYFPCWWLCELLLMKKREKRHVFILTLHILYFYLLGLDGLKAHNGKEGELS